MIFNMPFGANRGHQDPQTQNISAHADSLAQAGNPPENLPLTPLWGIMPNCLGNTVLRILKC